MVHNERNYWRGTIQEEQQRIQMDPSQLFTKVIAVQSSATERGAVTR
jgi:hypothetical protein